MSYPFQFHDAKLAQSCVPVGYHGVSLSHKSAGPFVPAARAEWHYGHLGGNHYVNSALFWECCLLSKRHACVGLNSYQRVPFHDQTWTPMRENIFWKKSLLIASLTCPQTNLPHLRRKTVMRSISQPYHLHRKSRIFGLDGVQQVPRTISVSDRPCNYFTEHTGCTQYCSKFSPVQIFQLYICQAVWKLMVEETNRYAAQTLSADTANQHPMKRDADPQFY